MPATQAGAAERRYSVTDFDRIVVEGPFTVRLATGRSPAATATGSAQAIDRVSVEVQGRTLRIRANRSAWGGYPGVAAGPVAIQVSTHELRSAMVAGPGSLAIDRAEGLRVDLSVEGAGRIAAAGVDVDNLILGVIGSGRIQIAGTAKELRASVHGWADLDASGLTAQGANITTDSAGRVAVAVVREARVTASGLGEVEIIGSPACTLSGLTASEVRCGDAGRR
ncbi:GIN domain-containing protein [Allosphingosinicella sp.]|uniref:GIN domain-containing protein n=1 Tax=Allosphingosinicella sp. TaxID=2823234 RepID=UPI002EE0A6A8